MREGQKDDVRKTHNGTMMEEPKPPNEKLVPQSQSLLVSVSYDLLQAGKPGNLTGTNVQRTYNPVGL